MTEHIEREAVLTLIQKLFDPTQVDGEEQIGVLKCHRIVREHPTADVVEVVRCEECKCLMKEIVVEQTPYGFENEKIKFGCQRILDLTGEWVDVMLDDFCSYGTPKERGGEK